MRYSIMLQLVATISLVFVGTAALFAWLQCRPIPEEQTKQTNIPTNSQVQTIE